MKNGQQPFSIKSTVNSKEETEFITKKVNSLNQALLSGNETRIRKLCDIDSLVDCYILQEISHNRDVGFASFYFYRKDGIFYFAPPWDFDLALGNDSGFGNALNEVYSDENRGNHWFESLYHQEWFMDLVRQRFDEIKPLINTLQGELLMMGRALEGAADRTYKKFPVMGSPVFLEPSELTAIRTYYGHVEFLSEWIGKRWTILKKTFNS